MTEFRRRPAGPPPDAAKLREVAIAHLARFAATEVGLRRVLIRRVDRWAREAEAEGQPEVAGQAAASRAAAGAALCQADPLTHSLRAQSVRRLHAVPRVPLFLRIAAVTLHAGTPRASPSRSRNRK
ncbi:hypothetical protein J4558_07610 [Leptolyngbya sp. 15MV]|nr:hypothetical protein J4558_07610 [Leptolyngbya sp. 15MV]